MRRLLAVLSLGLLCVQPGTGEVRGESPSFQGAREHRFPGIEAKDSRWQGPFFFAQLADTQFGMFDGDVKWEKETELFERAVREINRLKPRFVIICGDLVNQVPGGPYHEPQVAEFQRIARQIDSRIPLICVCGNHDVGNRPTPASLATYRREFGDDWFSFQIAGLYGIVLNSSLYWDPTGAAEEQAKQEAWFAAELDRAKASGAKHILVFQHHPWFLDRPEDPDQYFTIPRVRREPALALMRKAGVRAAFAGHYHRNALGRAGDFEMVTTSAVGKPLGKDPSGFRIVRVYANRIEHQYYGLDQMPAKIE